MSDSVFPYPRLQFFLNDGSPAALGTLTFTAAGTSTPLDTFSDEGLSVANPNPITLNSAGRPEVSGTEVNIYGSAALYDVVFKNAAGTTIWTSTDVLGQPGTGVLPSVFAVGDLLYADTTSTLARRAAVASGQVLASAGANLPPVYTPNPTVTSLTATTVTGTTVTGTAVNATTLTVTGLADLSAAGAGQIQFPATQNPSTNVNTLDDYEEGTWTPVLGGTGGTSGQSYASQHGEYVKIGKLVVANGTITFTDKGTLTGDLQIQGLPFTSGASDDGTGYFGDFDGTVASPESSWVASVILSGVTTSLLRNKGTDAATSMGSMDTSDIAADLAFQWTGIYRASA